MSRTVGNFAVLLIAMRWQIDVFNRDFGVHGHALLVALVLGWMSQTVWCVVEAPRGSSPDRPRRDAWGLAIVLAGLAPWIIVRILFVAHPGGPIWQSAPIPLAARGLGAVLALGLVLAPSRGEPLRQRTDSTALTVQSQLLLISTLLISGSPVFALLTMYFLAVVPVSRGLQRLLAAAVPPGVGCQRL